MVVLTSLKEIARAAPTLVGTKAKALAELDSLGFEVPPAMCITTDAYSEYMTRTRLDERVLFELGRKRFEDMRWEEIWDAALRIRNMFLATALPPEIHDILHDAVNRQFGDAPVVVRSSAPGEDSAEASFAGLHESLHTAPTRTHAMAVALSGIERKPLDDQMAKSAPLADSEVRRVYELALAAEQRFGAAQDVEWTRPVGSAASALSVLQSRPITTLSSETGDDKRSWYRSLTRSFENLKALRRRIEKEVVPGMQAEAAALARWTWAR